MRKIRRAITAILSRSIRLLTKLRKVADSAQPQSILIHQATPRSLYKTPYEAYFWLKPDGYLDSCIRDTGEFEPASTALVRSLIKPGDIILDIGANIGYYAVLFAQLTGGTGKVLCFEPTATYFETLKINIDANKLCNVELHKLGLSNTKGEQIITIGESSASLHQAGTKKETILLEKLDEFIQTHPLERIDFIKVDIDGHEPLFLDGAWNTIERFNPLILLEVSHPHYLDAGYTAWDFYDLLKSKGFRIYDEHTRREYENKAEFLRHCANFDRSANILISRNALHLTT